MILVSNFIEVTTQRQAEYAQSLGHALPNPRWETEKKKIIAENRADEFHLLVNIKTAQVTWHHHLNKVAGYKKAPACPNFGIFIRFLPFYIIPALPKCCIVSCAIGKFCAIIFQRKSRIFKKRIFTMTKGFSET
jgi:hypothetical protein